MTPVADNPAGFERWAIQKIKEENPGSTAMILISQGEITGRYFSGPQHVDANTLFPTASFSKWITALAVMTLVEQGTLDLDAPVARYLRRWQLPPSDFDNNQVTVRRLLSHTAGLTDGLGFGDYLPDQDLPGLVSTLKAPLSASGVRVIEVGQPPDDFLYSGGGYLILELLVEEVTGVTFAEYVERAVLNPLNMQRSTYAPIEQFDNFTPNYDTQGNQAPFYRYASHAATGFASTAADLSRLAEGLLTRNPIRPIKPRTLNLMLEPHGYFAGSPIWGLGSMLYVTTSQGTTIFGHDGANEPAINASMRLNPGNQSAIIVLTSGAGLLASNIGSQWVLWQTGLPDFLSIEQVIISALAPILIGSTAILLILVLWRRKRKSS